MTIDLLLAAGTVLTPEAIAAGGSSGPTAVAIRDGRIAGVAPADSATASAWQDEAALVLDLGDATITAGFVDAHIHPVMGLILTRGLDLSGITTASGVRDALTEYLTTRPDDEEWTLAWGLDPVVFGDGVVGNHLLDGVTGGRKVFITLFDGHSAVASRAALEAAGVRGDETFPAGSAVGVDAGGRPTGLLNEFAAQQLVLAHIPDPTFDDRVEQLGALLDGMAATGIVAGQMLDLMATDSFDLLDELERRRDLPIRLRISPSVFPGFTDDDLERQLAYQELAGRRWYVRGVKLMIDGTIDNGTAWLFEPDSHGDSTKSVWLNTDEYRRAVRFFHEHGIPTTTHAIGDKGIAFVAETLGALDPGPQPVQHRIEHIETLPDEVLDAIVSAGAAASMQPTHCTLYTRADHTDNWSRRLGDERADRGWRTRDLKDRGVILTLGSDWPIAPYDPREIVAAAQLRRPAGQEAVEPVQPHQGLSAVETLQGYTTEYWRSVGETGGTIEAGEPADLTVWSLNPLKADPDRFATADVVLTVVEGRVQAAIGVPVRS
ncbi:amidohydrolase [Leifsonia sp. 2MCAF36]|uniref:amidohydrolase n=1 Tax=Leifsonia sp. 2MCAF36 TaxID=3232988 RepID=UPI003F953CAC